MTFLEMHTAVPGLVEDGKAPIYSALDRLAQLGNAGTDEEKAKAAKILQSGLSRIEEIDRIGRRLQQTIHGLALMCMDNTIPLPTEEPDGI